MAETSFWQARLALVKQWLRQDLGCMRSTMVIPSALRSIDVQSIIQKCGHVSSDAMRRITRAVEIQTGVYEEGDYDSRRI